MREQLLKAAEALITAVPTLPKPLAAVLYAGEHLGTVSAVFEARDQLLKAGIAVYPTMEAAARAISQLIKFNDFAKRPE
jgi:acyl-CoA synthetase (NDP forming)